MTVHGGLIFVKLDDIGVPFGCTDHIFEPNVDVLYSGVVVKLASEGVPFRQSRCASLDWSTCMVYVELNDVVVAPKGLGEACPFHPFDIAGKREVRGGVS